MLHDVVRQQPSVRARLLLLSDLRDVLKKHESDGAWDAEKAAEKEKLSRKAARKHAFKVNKKREMKRRADLASKFRIDDRLPTVIQSPSKSVRRLEGNSGAPSPLNGSAPQSPLAATSPVGDSSFSHGGGDSSFTPRQYSGTKLPKPKQQGGGFNSVPVSVDQSGLSVPSPLNRTPGVLSSIHTPNIGLKAQLTSTTVMYPASPLTGGNRSPFSTPAAGAKKPRLAEPKDKDDPSTTSTSQLSIGIPTEELPPPGQSGKVLPLTEANMEIHSPTHNKSTSPKHLLFDPQKIAEAVVIPPTLTTRAAAKPPLAQNTATTNPRRFNVEHVASSATQQPQSPTQQLLSPRESGNVDGASKVMTNQHRTGHRQLKDDDQNKATTQLKRKPRDGREKSTATDMLLTPTPPSTPSHDNVLSTSATSGTAPTSLSPTGEKAMKQKSPHFGPSSLTADVPTPRTSNAIPPVAPSSQRQRTQSTVAGINETSQIPSGELSDMESGHVSPVSTNTSGVSTDDDWQSISSGDEDSEQDGDDTNKDGADSDDEVLRRNSTWLERSRNKSGPFGFGDESKNEDELGVRYVAGEDELAFRRFMDEAIRGDTAWMQEFLDDDDLEMIASQRQDIHGMEFVMEDVGGKNGEGSNRRSSAAGGQTRRRSSIGAAADLLGLKNASPVKSQPKLLDTNATNELIDTLLTTSNPSAVVESTQAACPHCKLLPTQSVPLVYEKGMKKFWADRKKYGPRRSTFVGSPGTQPDSITKKLEAMRKIEKELREADVTRVSAPTEKPAAKEGADGEDEEDDDIPIVYTGVARRETVEVMLPPEVPNSLITALDNEMWRTFAAEVLRASDRSTAEEKRKVLIDRFHHNMQQPAWKAVNDDISRHYVQAQLQANSNLIRARKRLTTIQSELTSSQVEYEALQVKIGAFGDHFTKDRLMTLIELQSTIEEKEAEMALSQAQLSTAKQDAEFLEDDLDEAKKALEILGPSLADLRSAFQLVHAQLKISSVEKAEGVVSSNAPLQEPQFEVIDRSALPLSHTYGPPCKDCGHLQGNSKFCGATGKPHAEVPFHKLLAKVERSAKNVVMKRRHTTKPAAGHGSLNPQQQRSGKSFSAAVPPGKKSQPERGLKHFKDNMTPKKPLPNKKTPSASPSWKEKLNEVGETQAQRDARREQQQERRAQRRKERLTTLNEASLSSVGQEMLQQDHMERSGGSVEGSSASIPQGRTVSIVTDSQEGSRGDDQTEMERVQREKSEKNMSAMLLGDEESLSDDSFDGELDGIASRNKRRGSLAAGLNPDQKESSSEEEEEEDEEEEDEESSEEDVSNMSPSQLEQRRRKKLLERRQRREDEKAGRPPPKRRKKKKALDDSKREDKDTPSNLAGAQQSSSGFRRPNDITSLIAAFTAAQMKWMRCTMLGDGDGAAAATKELHHCQEQYCLVAEGRKIAPKVSVGTSAQPERPNSRASNRSGTPNTSRRASLAATPQSRRTSTTTSPQAAALRLPPAAGAQSRSPMDLALSPSALQQKRRASNDTNLLTPQQLPLHAATPSTGAAVATSLMSNLGEIEDMLMQLNNANNAAGGGATTANTARSGGGKLGVSSSRVMGKSSQLGSSNVHRGSSSNLLRAERQGGGSKKLAELVLQQTQLKSEIIKLKEVLRFAHIPAKALLLQASEYETEADDLFDRIRREQQDRQQEQSELDRLLTLAASLEPQQRRMNSSQASGTASPRSMESSMRSPASPQQAQFSPKEKIVLDAIHGMQGM